MSEKPIIFSADMVRAILEGRKTQTRRVVKPQPSGGLRWNAVVVNGHGGWTDMHGDPRGCPYGKTDCRLWVRETWGYSAALPTSAHYTRDDSTWCAYPDMRGYKADDPPGNWCWKPSIHMPRWASRITLQVTDVRVERVQDISEADAMAEGVVAWHDTVDGTVYRPEFHLLWDSINATRGFGWSANPWVWVIEFERVQP